MGRRASRASVPKPRSAYPPSRSSSIPRATFISTLAIPTTLAITFLFLHWAGETLNLMSLGGLAVAFGLIVPPAFHLFSWLAPLAAAGLVLVMVGAAIFHARKSEFPAAALTVFLGGLAALTVFLRWEVVPL